MEEVRTLSSRELEALELTKEKVQETVDAVDERWPEILAAAALAKDCKDALVKNGFPESLAYQLVGPMMQYLKR